MKLIFAFFEWTFEINKKNLKFYTNQFYSCLIKAFNQYSKYQVEKYFLYHEV